jgi:hypothetical protein
MKRFFFLVVIYYLAQIPLFAQYIGGNGSGTHTAKLENWTLSYTGLIYMGGTGGGDENSNAISNGHLGNFWLGRTNELSSANNWSAGRFPLNESAWIGNVATPPQIVSACTIDSQTILGVLPNASLQVSSTAAITVHGRIENMGTFTLKCDSLSCGAIANSSGVIAGKVWVERYIPGGRRAYRFLAHPFSEAISLSQLVDDIHVTGAGVGNTLGTLNSNGFDATVSNNPSAFYFDEALFQNTSSNPWVPFSSAMENNKQLLPGTAARVLIRGSKEQGVSLLQANPPTPQAITIDWQGAINQGAVNRTLLFTPANGSYSGWNFIGNPYASPIDVGLIPSERRNSIHNFSYWNPNMGVKGAYVSRSFGTTCVMPSGAVFIVKTGGNGTFTFQESDKVNSSALAVFKKENTSNLQLQVSSGKVVWDVWTFAINEQAQATFDERDGIKMVNPDVNFYSYLSDGTHLAIDQRKSSSYAEIPLAIDVGEETSFNIKVGEFNAQDYSFTLIDKFANKSIPLQAAVTYSFHTTNEETSKGAHRFVLQVSALVNGIEQFGLNQSLQVYPNPCSGILHLTSTGMPEGEYEVSIYNLMGDCLFKRQLFLGSNRNQSIEVENLPAACYVIAALNKENNQVFYSKFMKQ